MGWLIDLAEASIPDPGTTGKSLWEAPDALPPLSRTQEARRQKLLANLARGGGQYATLIEDPNTEPVILALATRTVRASCRSRGTSTTRSRSWSW